MPTAIGYVISYSIYLVPAGAEGEPPYQTFRQHAASLVMHLKEIKHSEDSRWLERIKRWHYNMIIKEA